MPTLTDPRSAKRAAARGGACGITTSALKNKKHESFSARLELRIRYADL
jgi:hypothetical protein